MIALAATSLCLISPSATDSNSFYISSFKADVTVPMGHALMGGGIAPASSVADPLWAKGLVLYGSDAPIVFLAVDWCEIRNDAYDRWRDVIAEAAGTTRERVLVGAIHQHDAPVADFEAQRLLDEHGLPRALCDSAFVEVCIRRTAQALREAAAEKRTVTHYGAGAAMVQGVASNRRIVNADGAVHYGRGSGINPPELRDAPDGEIDPLLKTLSFWNEDEPLASVSTYAVHPMSYYGKGAVSADFPGLARQQREAELPGVQQIYFSGCSGDVTAGKYNDGNPDHMEILAERLAQGMRDAWTATEKRPIREVRFETAPLVLKLKDFGGYGRDQALATLADSSKKTFDRILAAMSLSWRRRTEAQQPIDVPVVDFGEAAFLLMPAESFVRYQLTAQALSPGRLVLTAGYGECGPGYIPSDRAAAEGYNHESWCWVAPVQEHAMRQAFEAALSTK